MTTAQATDAKSLTAGQEFARTIRRYLHIGPRTRNRRRGEDMKARVMHEVLYASTAPGYHVPRVETALRPAMAAIRSWEKHVEGFRIDGALAYQLSLLTPWEFVGLLAEMVDAGVSNVGEGEMFFARLRERFAA